MAQRLNTTRMHQDVRGICRRDTGQFASRLEIAAYLAGIAAAGAGKATSVASAKTAGSAIGFAKGVAVGVAMSVHAIGLPVQALWRAIRRKSETHAGVRVRSRLLGTLIALQLLLMAACMTAAPPTTPSPPLVPSKFLTQFGTDLSSKTLENRLRAKFPQYDLQIEGDGPRESGADGGYSIVAEAQIHLENYRKADGSAIAVVDELEKYFIDLCAATGTELVKIHVGSDKAINPLTTDGKKYGFSLNYSQTPVPSGRTGGVMVGSAADMPNPVRIRAGEHAR